MTFKITKLRFKQLNSRLLSLIITLTVILTTTTAFGDNSLTFSSSSLSNGYCQQLLAEGVITHANPVFCERLKRINFSYSDENSKIKQDGELVVLDVLAPKVIALTKALLKQKFVIYSAKPIENYQGDDELSMAANNSSAFNGRAITGGNALLVPHRVRIMQ